MDNLPKNQQLRFFYYSKVDDGFIIYEVQNGQVAYFSYDPFGSHSRTEAVVKKLVEDWNRTLRETYPDDKSRRQRVRARKYVLDSVDRRSGRGFSQTYVIEPEYEVI